MKTKMNNHSGFTLIEVIASLIIMSIVALVAAMGLISGVQAYVSTRTNTESLQRAEYALNRIKLEFMNMDSVSSASSNSITFTSEKTNRAPGTVYVLMLAEDGIILVVNGSRNPLITGLGAYGAGQAFLTYANNTGGAWTTAQEFKDLHTINIRMSIPRSDGSESFIFTTAVNPRNNGLSNGPSTSQ